MNLKSIAYFPFLFGIFFSFSSLCAAQTELFFDQQGRLVANPTITETNDNIAGSNDSDVLNGHGGNDLIYGLGGQDILDGGEGSDRVYGGADDDLIIGTLDAADDLYDGGDGYDTVIYVEAQKTLHFSFDAKGGVAKGEEIGTDILSEIEHIITGHGNDIVEIAPDAPPLTLTYVAGEDDFSLSSAKHVKISFFSGITPSLVTVKNLAVDNAGRVTTVSLVISGKGTLKLQGDNLNGQVLSFFGDKQKKITATGLEHTGHGNPNPNLQTSHVCDPRSEAMRFVLKSDNREIKETFNVPLRYMSMGFEREGRMDRTLHLAAILDTLEPICHTNGEVAPIKDSLEVELSINLRTEEEWINRVKKSYSDTDKHQFEEIDIDGHPDFIFKASNRRHERKEGAVNNAFDYIPVYPNKNFNIPVYFRLECGLSMDMKTLNLCRMRFLYRDKKNIVVNALFHSQRLENIEQIYAASISLIKKFHTE